MIELIRKPWPWYITGPLIGMMVPLLLLLGNKKFGISSSLRHICAVCFPGTIPFFKYNWKKEVWNLVFAIGIIAGAFLAVTFLSDHQPMRVNPKLVHELSGYAVTNYDHLAPSDLFNWSNLL